MGAGENRVPNGLKPKDLIGIPWRVAFALQADGWYLRSEIIWHKPSPMPESVNDRPTKAHEQLFLLTKRPRYYYDAEAVKEPATADDRSSSGKPAVFGGADKHSGYGTRIHSGREYHGTENGFRNRRTVWTVASQPYPGAHFATFPPKLIEPCILAGTSEYGCCVACGAPYTRIVESKKLTRERPNEYVKRNGTNGTGNSCANTVAGVESRTIGWEPTCKCGTTETVPCVVLDPFGGSGTTGQVAMDLGRRFVLCELNPEYVEQIKERLKQPALC